MAMVLKGVDDNPTKNSKGIAEALGIEQASVKRTLVRLRIRGLITLHRKHLNSRDVVWRLTDEARNSRKPPLLVLKGDACRPYLNDGYTPLPARKEVSRG